MHTRMLTYFILAGLSLTLGLSLAGDVIVRLSPPAYRSAASLIPWTSFAFVVYGMYVIIARTTAHRHRDLVHNGSAALAAIVYLGMSAAIVPRWGGYGLATASAVGMGIGCACFRALVPTATKYAKLEWPRLIGGAVITFACLALSHAIRFGPARVAFDVIDFFLIYPAALIFVGVLPRGEAEVAYKIAVGVAAQLLAPLRPARSGSATVAALATLEPADVELLHTLIKDRTPARKVALRSGVPLSVTVGSAARALRQMTGSDGSERDDAAIGHWLFDTEGSAEQDVISNFLVDHGVGRMTLHRVEDGLAALRALPSGLWPRGSGGDARAPTGGLTLEPSLIEIG
jgi:hypothetical protein